MASKLITHLKNQIKEDSSLDVLGHQWGFDEQLVGKALQNISTLYPHYSRHDASHSKQILINIERILGPERIKSLTATDTWLILESAYWHDIGMLVTDAEYKAASQSEDFKVFIENIKEDSNHHLNKLCSCFQVKNGTWQFDEIFPYQTINKFRELFAEWFRGLHAERSYDVIQSPWERCGLSSPRTELIPSRLYMILGRICEMHGSPFELLINEQKGLAFKEVGIGTDDCHPRFVASLLRLGDLLDIDDNRFCPVMCKIAGEHRPNLSKVHEKKHRSIRHFRLDSNQIEITCVCTADNFEEQINTYLETLNWFDWLEDEIKNQMTNWTKISPSKEFGLLPTIGYININFNNENFFLPTDARPEFGISTEKATEILQSLYKDQFSCIRELLQNSVDATLVELFLLKNLSKSDKLVDVFKKAQKHEILVTITEIDTSKDNLDSEFDYFTLKIQDRGCGISINDFKHMLKIGDSANNINKKYIIKQMPPMHRPSGTFGIGFQSIFLLSNKVKITSHCRRTNENTRVVLHNPLGKKTGLCTFERLDFSLDYGTTLEVVIKLDPKLYKNIKHTKDGYFNQENSNFDPIIEDINRIHKFKIFDKISEFAHLSPIPIKAEYRLSGDKSSKQINVESQLDDSSWVYLNHNEIDFCYLITPIIENNSTESNIIYYKGQKINQPSEQVDEKLLSFSSFRIKLNILSGNVTEWLTAERDKIRDNQAELLNSLIFEGLKSFIEKSGGNLKHISLEVNHNIIFNYSERLHELYSKNLKNAWLNIDRILHSVKTGKKENRTYHIQDLMKWVDGNPMLKGVELDFKTYNDPSLYFKAILGNGTQLERMWVTSLAHKETLDDKSGFSFDASEEYNSITLTFTDDGIKTITPNYLAFIFLREHKQPSTRPIIPFTDEMHAYESISIDFNDLKKLNGSHCKIPTERIIISPFIMRTSNERNVFYKKERIEELSEFLISEGLINIDKEKCIELFNQFSDYVSMTIMKSDTELQSNWTRITPEIK
ncbi:ATP-binding protein [Shewanella japonica]|uniref:HD domain-containing protein n=1 Tax=Shewanella japonica TaxID=93973 RepID=UPI000E70AC90|nr:ATP-binding protein [Shewanella japonica]